MTPTFSLGCGTWGGSNTTENVNYHNLLNIKAVSRRQTPHSGSGCPRTHTSTRVRWRTSGCSDLNAPMIVTDSPSEARGVADVIRRALGADARAVHVFSAIEPEPTEEQIRAGIEELQRFDADAIIAVGGGSVLDAAKAMRLFHETRSSASGSSRCRSSTPASGSRSSPR